MAYSLSREAFQRDLHGQRTDLFTLRGAGGLQVAVSNYGARLVQVAVPDGQGALVDVALGYDSLQGYLGGQQSMGAFIGRWAGRLRNGSLTLPGGSQHPLPTNSGPHHHHGGPRGSRFQVFALDGVKPDALTLSHTFRTEDDGVPGTVRLQLHLHVTADNALHMAWTAQVADAPTVFNPTGHAFFNLAGVGTTHHHRLQVPASRYVPLAADVCPEGTVAPVQATPFDFRQPKSLGDAVALTGASTGAPRHEQLARAGGLDHYLVLDDAPHPAQPGWAQTAAPASPNTPTGLRPAALLSEPTTGRAMEVWTTAPGVQVYAAHGLQADPVRDLGRGAEAGHWLWQPGDGICLEPMEYPDAPNQPAFPVRWWLPGDVVQGAIVYRFLG